MIIREAKLADIPQMHEIRMSVKENVLSNPGLVTEADYEKFISQRGKGWVCEVNERLLGFAIADLQDSNIWALFIRPEFENKGIGKQLHNIMLDRYFNQTSHTVWLGTTPGTRAEQFYRKMGWTAVGMHGKDELKFEMTAGKWKAHHKGF